VDESFTVAAGQTQFAASNAITQETAVPEPTTLLILRMGLTALGLMRRRQVDA